MDTQRSQRKLLAYLAPFLPYFVKAGDKAVKEAGKLLGASAWERVKTLWAKLAPKIDAKPAAPGGDQSRGRLFISYSRKNKVEVYPFADALAQAGIDIWIDKEGIDFLDDFPAKISDSLAHSHALLAWYSSEYAHSRYCQEELTAAWICARRLTHDVLSRIFILNPEDGVAHIALGDVGRENYLAPKDAASLAACIDAIRERLTELSGDFAAVQTFRPPEWRPSARPRAERFVGRLKELWRIHTRLNPVGISPHEDSQVVVQLVGLGGVGKTLLATEYALRFGAAYPGGVYWLRAYGFDAQQPLSTEDREGERQRQIEDIALDHGIEIKDADFRKITRDLARTLAASGTPYLWVVDDLPPGLDEASAFPAWSAPSTNGHTLITTRSMDYAGIGITVEINVLEPDPAYELLTHARKPRTEQEEKDARALAEDLGMHPLALDVAGHFLLKTKSFGPLRRDLASAQTDVLGNIVAGLKGQLPGGHEKSLVSTLVKSVELLGEEGRSFMRLLCELRGGTPIPFKLAKATFGDAFALSEPEAETYLLNAVNQLEMNSLATPVLGGTAGDALSVHNLVRYTMQHGDPARAQAKEVRQKLRDSAVVAMPELLVNISDIRKHATLVWEVSHAQHLASDPHTLEEAMLGTWLGHYERARGNYRAARSITEKALSILERVLGESHPAVLITRGYITVQTGEMGNASEALRLAYTLLPDEERVLGKDHPEVLAARGNIAAWTGQTGDRREALRLSRELLPDLERVLGKDDPRTLRSRANIATWTGETGDRREALRLFQELLPDLERVLGKDHPDTFTTRSHVAAWTGETGDRREALRLSRELLPDRERVLGKDHPDVLGTRASIAAWTGEMGDASEALRLFQELLPDRERVLGKDHPDVLGTRASIASLSGRAGDASEALRLFQDLLPDRERVLGKDHPDTFITRNNIATWTGRTGDRHEAMRLFQELLPDRERVLGKDHPETLLTRDSIAFWTGETGDKREALRLFQELLPDRERVLGKDHPDVLGTRHNIAAWTGETGDVSEALRLFQELLPDQERVLGKDHPQVLITRAIIAAWAGQTGDRREALRLSRELLPDLERALGKDHPNVLGTRANIAFWTGETGDVSEALRLFQELLPDLERVLGKDHPHTLRSRDYIAALRNLMKS